MRHLKIYRAILAIQRSGSIRKAAEGLAISPSALNRALQGFEDEIGIPLFDRVPSGVALTAAGELLVPVLQRHLIEFDDLQGQMRNLRDGVSGRVSLSLGRDLDAGPLLDAIATFEAAFPGVSVSIDSDDSLAALKQRRVDLAVVTAPRTDDAVEVLYGCEMPLVAWQAGPTGPVSGLWDVMRQRLVLPPEATGTHIAVQHLLRRNRLTPESLTTIAASQMRARGTAGRGICIVPQIACATALDMGGLTRLDLPLGQVQISILRATSVPLKKAAMALSVRLQAALDAHTG